MKIALRTQGYKGDLVKKTIKAEGWDIIEEEDADIIFCIGLTKMLKGDLSKFVVLHDSILPGYKGFCPTVAALINGEQKIGVTAFRPNEEMDSGEIIANCIRNIKYPIKIQEAYIFQSINYIACMEKVVHPSKNMITLLPNIKESYTIWRDWQDYIIDWNWSSDGVERFVNAVGYPYDGAYTGLYKVLDGHRIDDINFVHRHPGKIWKINGTSADVVCGNGMYRITEARNVNSGKLINFGRLRCRL